MPTKTVSKKTTTATTTVAKAAAAAPKRTASPRTPRVTPSRHTKAAVATEPAVPAITAPVQVNAQEAIAAIAYGYWEARGYQGGDQLEDWLRAEAAFAATA